MSNRYSGFPASLYLAGTLVHLRQLENWGFSANSNKSLYTPGGSLDRMNAGLQSAKPMHRFGTRDLKTIFDNVSPSVGADSVDPLASANGAEWRFQQRNCQSGFKTNSHIGRSTEAGYVKPVSVSAAEDDTHGAMVDLEYYSISVDGLTFPETKAAIADLSGAPQPTFTSQYFFGPTYYNSVLIDGLDRVSINFGINVDAKLFGYVFPRCYTIQDRAPSITVSGTNSAIDVAVQQLINSSAGAWVHYLRRGASGNSRVADNVASHMSFSLATSEWCVNEESWSETADNQVSVEIQAINATVAVGVDVAIP